MKEGWLPEIDPAGKYSMPNERVNWSFVNSMKVGESAFVPHITTEHAPGHLKYRAMKLNAKFTCRYAKQDGLVGVRVWRIK